MSILNAIERELLDADRREGERRALEASMTPAAAPARRERLGGRWRRLGRGGRVAGFLAGGLVLGAVATGSAQVAGLDPWGKLVGQDRIDPALRPFGGADGSVGVRVADAPGRPGWELRAYVARNGKLCVIAAGRGGEGLYDCRTSDHAAIALTGRPKSGPPLVGVRETGPVSFTPKRLVVWALTDWAAPAPRFVVPARAVVRTLAAQQPLRVAVDHSTAGLSKRGRALVDSLPQAVTLRLTVAEVSSPRPLAVHGDPVVVPPGAVPAGQPSIVQLTTATDWNAAHHGRRWTIDDDGVLDRRDQPVVAATDRELLSYPALARPRVPSQDEIPRSALTRSLSWGRIQPAASRRLRVSGTGDLGPIWLAPGGFPDAFTIPTVDGQVCLAGPRALSDCMPTDARGTLPDPESVVCARGLPKGQFLVWAFVPAGAHHVRVDFTSGPSATYSAADLLVLLRPRTAPRPTQLEWSGPRKMHAVAPVVFPPHPTAAICGSGQAPHYRELRRSATSSAESHD